MNFLIVGLVKNQQLKRLQEEGEKRGHQIDGAYTSQLIIKASPTTFTPVLKGQQPEQLHQYDLIYLWATGKRRWEWFTAADYLKQKHQVKIINQKIVDTNYNYFLTPASDYLKQTKNHLPYPRSAIIFNAQSARAITADFSFPLILKINPSRQGRRVFKINSPAELENTINKSGEAVSFVIREFIPNDGDIRVFTIGYRAVGAMKRTPKKGDFRANISQGGSGEKLDLAKHPKIKKLAEAAARITKTEIAGVDIILHQKTRQPYILEVNPGPQFTGLEKYTKLNIAQEMIRYFEKVASGQ